MFTIMGELDNSEIKHGIEKYKDEGNAARQFATRYLRLNQIIYLCCLFFAVLSDNYSNASP